MSVVTVTWSGLSEFEREVRRNGADIEDVSEVTRAIAARLASSARSRAPFRGGGLSGSVRSMSTRSSASVTAGTGIDYAAPIHWGWPRRNIAAQPFLYDALGAEGPWIVGQFEKLNHDLKRRLERSVP